MQFLRYDDPAGEVEVYHTVPSQAGTSGFEHRGMVKLGALAYARRPTGAEDPGVFVVPCPVPGCAALCWVPLTGDRDAQRFHAHARAARGPTGLDAAIRSVIEDVEARGHRPRLDPAID